ncbi:MAG: hypothetical protein ACI85X_000576 [Woeseiaceae bacterium]|jgi:hypothetical protein|tara:strand:- start:1263 stop:2513 length:1251 start_codon:yes stop_codon:yes gene_type:complete
MKDTILLQRKSFKSNPIPSKAKTVLSRGRFNTGKIMHPPYGKAIQKYIFIIFCYFSASIAADDDLQQSYTFDEETWIQPFSEEGFTWGGNSGVHVESKDRIFFLQRGETKLPQPIPPSYTDFPASMGIPDWNVLLGRGRVWQNCIYITNSQGDIIDIWDHWDHLFQGTNGPGPHRIRINPYDEDKKVWVVDETGHIIYVFSNDGKELLLTIGEKNIPGNDRYHLNLPQDVAFLPNGKYLIADGIGNKRIIIRNKDHSYHSEFGEEGNEPHQYGSVHSLAFGPNEMLYVVDRINKDMKIYHQIAEVNSSNYPNYQYIETWSDLGVILDVIVNDQSLWVTESNRNPPRLKQYDFDGNFLQQIELPTSGSNFWIEMHSISVDESGNLYATDNQAGRPRKLSPAMNADIDKLVKMPYRIE